MILVQIFVEVFLLVLLFLVFFHYKKGDVTLFDFIFWSLLWILSGIAILIPNKLQKIAQNMELVRSSDLLILIGFCFSISLIFYLYIKYEKQQKQIESIVREVAIKKAKKIKKK